MVSFGGELVKNLIPPQTPDNADYLFRSEEVIAEFKFIKTDRENDPDIQKKVEAKIEAWRDSGRLPGLHYGSFIISNQLPRGLQWELAKIHAKPIRRKIHKANTQIKLTRSLLNLPQAKGLVLLANEADRSMPPEHLTFAVHQSLIHDFSGIDHVVVLTANLAVLSSRIPSRLRLWLDYRRDNKDHFNPDFLRRLRSDWSHFLSNLLGEPLPIIANRSAVDLSLLRYE